MSLRRAATAVLAVLLLSACASQPARTPAAPLDAAQLQAQAAQRAAMSQWTLSGRVAVSNGRQGGSGRIDWSQAGGRYDIRLAAPVTRQSWRLAGDATAARLEGVDGGPREADDVERLLREATGWEIPVRAMVDWVRGLAAGEAVYGPARWVAGADGLPGVLEQAGWRVEYRDWQAGEGGLRLPRRVEAQQGEARVRLLVDAWEPGPMATGADGDAPDAVLARTLRTLRLEDPGTDVLERVAAGDLRPVAVCGFACLTPGVEPAAGRAGPEPRIIDGSGDVIAGEHHLQLKHQAEAYARAYNAALAAWLRAHPQPPARADEARPGPGAAG